MLRMLRISLLLLLITTTEASVLMMANDKIAMGTFNDNSEDSALCGNQVYRVHTNLCCGGKVYRDEGALFTCCGNLPCLTNVGVQVYNSLGGRLPDSGALKFNNLLYPQQAPTPNYWQKPPRRATPAQHLMPFLPPLGRSDYYYDYETPYDYSMYYQQAPPPSLPAAPHHQHLASPMYYDYQPVAPRPPPYQPSRVGSIAEYLHLPHDQIQYVGSPVTTPVLPMFNVHRKNDRKKETKATNTPSLFVIGGPNKGLGPIMRTIPNLIVKGGGLTLAKDNPNKYFATV